MKNAIESALLKANEQYQSEVIRKGGIPTTSEMFRQGILESGFSGALQAYLWACSDRAQTQMRLLGVSGKAAQIALTTLFATVVGPVETAATLLGKGKEIENFNRSLGAADWVSTNQEEEVAKKVARKQHEAGIIPANQQQIDYIAATKEEKFTKIMNGLINDDPTVKRTVDNMSLEERQQFYDFMREPAKPRKK